MTTQTSLTSLAGTQPDLHPAFPGALPDSAPSLSAPRRSAAIATLCALWAAIFFASLFAPPLLDDADATHSNAARHILTSGDWVTLYVNGIRYLEKAPLPYWLVAASFKVFGFNTFAAHLPQAIAVQMLALLGYFWGTQAFNPRTGLYTGIAILTSAGVFLFTRIFIPEVWLSLFLATALYTFLQSLTPATNAVAPHLDSEMWDGATRTPDAPSIAPLSSAMGGPSHESANRLHALYPYLTWTSLALAVLTKGLVALVFFSGTATLYLALTGEHRHWRRLKPITGAVLFLAIAAPWHILAGLRNTGGFLQGHTHGFFWFYFVNEHFLRFLGKRYPVDYNKLPGYLFWSLHLVWLFPWALFAPLSIAIGWPMWRQRRNAYQHAIKTGKLRDPKWSPYGWRGLPRYAATSFSRKIVFSFNTSAGRTTLLLLIYSALVLLFFSFSTNQEYYTFPAYLPLLMLLMAALTRAEGTYATDKSSRRWIIFAHAALTVVGIAAAAALFLGLWTSRKLPFVPDIGELLAHRGVGDYTLSMSHLFDLTGPSFAALRLPAILAAVAFAFGPAIAWFLRSQRRHLAATGAIALTSATFLIAAHIALIRFGPMLSSQNLAAKIIDLRHSEAIAPGTQIMLYGDQSYGSSIPFYLGQQVSLVEGRSSSMIFGSTFPDAPPIFLTNSDLLAGWGTGPRKLLFVPLEKRDDLDRVIPTTRQLVLAETSGKALITDRPLDIR
jgi:4-amino-4-deoxy-L-arabinose transferase-like glycosyltransferase